ncbi:[protein-PII] uridylyltransferase [Thalassoglobus sp. JC818]|uniref:[protein-PII] uridylyltransferase n=1 Tax=Thalassoglobus sp. JC818 TaxID=3232136 RepID=UPI00345A37B9
MSPGTPPTFQQIDALKKRVIEIRDKAQSLFDSGAQGLQIAGFLSESFDDFLVNLADNKLKEFPEEIQRKLLQDGAIVAIGGTGRGDMAPYSDIDLLFLHERGTDPAFFEFVAQYVQSCWDAKIQIGNSTRDITTCLAFARQDPQIATPLVEARWLWGNERLIEKLQTQFKQRVLFSRRKKFIDDCIAAREVGWSEYGPPAQELEPDIKTSSGGLRDLHLIRWIGFARYGVKDIDSLRLKGAITKSDARRLKAAWEFLTRLRIDLHLSAGKEHDRLTRDEQLRIADERNYDSQNGQRPVEIFMQEYFHHSSELAAITRRFVAMERPRSIAERTRDIVVGHRAEGMFFVSSDRIEVADRHMKSVCGSLESMLHLYKAAALYNVLPSPKVAEAIKKNLPESPAELSPRAAKTMVEIFQCTSALGPILRSMFQTRLLDVVIPQVTHIRNLLQFNQYHHFTVDEHTLRAIENATRFERNDGPAGIAYQEIRHKEVLHLAVLLHDIGKGMNTDHSVIGAEIAIDVGKRLHMPDYQIEQMSLLVRQHLVMADLAFRRDITDQQLILNFSREIGSPDVLKMLYTLTIADVSAVGPGTWNTWKENLLTELYDRCLVILSGKRYSYHEQQRIAAVKESVRTILQDRKVSSDAAGRISQLLTGFSAYYLTCTPAQQIADDLQVIVSLDDERVEVIASWDAATGSMEYRVMTANDTIQADCFHKMTGVLTAKRLAIISADINTTTNGVVVDSFRVIDSDFDGEPPRSRVAEVAQLLRKVLWKEITVEELFRMNRRFGASPPSEPASGLTDRVNIDNDSSDSRTIIDVFAADRPGLLYTLTRALYQMDVSINMAKISTHFDQIVDVFYVQEQNRTRLRGEERLRQVREGLMEAVHNFRQQDYRQFEKPSK